MEKVIKIALIAFVVVLLCAIGITRTLPKDRLTFEEELNLRKSVKMLNDNLPRRLGTIGSLDSITYHKRSIGYHLSVFGDPSINDLYRSHYNDFHDVFLYSIAALNGQNGNATKLAEYCNAKKIGMTTTIFFSNKESMAWEFTPSEPLDFIQTYNGTPTEAVGRVLDFHIALANYNCSSITTNTISSLTDEGIVLLSLENLSNSIVWNWGVDEKRFDMEQLSSSFHTEGFASLLIEEMIKDLDVQELINIISISRSNIILRYRGLTSNRSMEITIPYNLIKQHSQVPNLH